MYGVQAMNIGGATEFYKELAEQTGGAYVRFTNFSVISDMFMAGTNKTLEFPFQLKHLNFLFSSFDLMGGLDAQGIHFFAY